MIEGKTSSRSTEAAAARSLFLVVITDILCWLPVAIMGLMVAAGVKIPVEIYAWIIVLVLPINSAINPYLYTMSSVKIRHRQSRKYTTKNNTITSSTRINDGYEHERKKIENTDDNSG
ncbi:hypothetical protein FSP39_014236 [Pinctada imbricata]|uniref:G-protein coupled receptors family 1 profile domain-containing protein n=1 Tax=Pinctada imbricata TaxID=66713 RepID=A0AA88YEZ4_PINIB|nr:hypothetical protein FSP39_014236 [Pinctada imbricata]